MRVLICYGTTEGQTRKIARACADTLVDAGHSVELLDTESAGDLQIGRFDACLLAASVHAGRYQSDFVSICARHHADIAEKPNLFLSVSLAAAGDDAEDWKVLEQGVKRFSADTGWYPAQVEHIAGAFRFSEYDFFKYWAMRWIASVKGDAAPRGEDIEYTDWEALKALVLGWAGAVDTRARPA